MVRELFLDLVALCIAAFVISFTSAGLLDEDEKAKRTWLLLLIDVLVWLWFIGLSAGFVSDLGQAIALVLDLGG